MEFYGVLWSTYGAKRALMGHCGALMGGKELLQATCGALWCTYETL